MVNPKKAEFNINLKKLFYQHAGIFGNVSALVSLFKNFDSNKNGSFDIGKLNLEPVSFDSKLSIKKILRSGLARVVDRKYLEYLLKPNEKISVLGVAIDDTLTPV